MSVSPSGGVPCRDSHYGSKANRFSGRQRAAEPGGSTATAASGTGADAGTGGGPLAPAPVQLRVAGVEDAVDIRFSICASPRPTVPRRRLRNGPTPRPCVAPAKDAPRPNRSALAGTSEVEGADRAEHASGDQTGCSAPLRAPTAPRRDRVQERREGLAREPAGQAAGDAERRHRATPRRPFSNAGQRATTGGCSALGGRADGSVAEGVGPTPTTRPRAARRAGPCSCSASQPGRAPAARRGRDVETCWWPSREQPTPCARPRCE